MTRALFYLSTVSQRQQAEPRALSQSDPSPKTPTPGGRRLFPISSYISQRGRPNLHQPQRLPHALSVRRRLAILKPVFCASVHTLIASALFAKVQIEIFTLGLNLGGP
jgi:hypothetical protein